MSSDKQPNTILVKPAGPDCNMACTYCFYLEKDRLFPDSKVHRMTEELLEETIKQVMTQAGKYISFGWQGGEPTLMGLPFFERVVELQEKYGRGQTVGNGLQTNGVLIDKNWARHLAKYNFLVGLSLDGPEHVHDRYRKTAGGAPSWEKVRDRAKLMLDADVAVNALSVVNDYSVDFPEEIYSFLKELGLNHMQFIPIVERDKGDANRPAPFSASPEKFGIFLCRLFDLWLSDFKDGTPQTSIRLFDAVFHTYAGLIPPDCTLLEECGVYVVVEHNGDVFACDFFVEPGWKLGNIRTGRLIDMLNSPRQVEFGRIKSDLPRLCLECAWLRYCRGGCPKDRIGKTKGGDLNYLCESFKRFYEHAHDRLKEMARSWKKEQAEAREAERQAYLRHAAQNRPKVSRNDPCPCGSGLKFKKCCGRSRP